MKKLFVALAALVATLSFVAGAGAHPLGNFTINRYSRVEPSGDRLYVLYVLDMAEIPTFQAKPDVDARGEAAYGTALAASLAKHVAATIGGRPVALRPVKHVLAFPPGQAGLRTTRLEVLLASPTARAQRRTRSTATATTRVASAGRRSSCRPGRVHTSQARAPRRARSPTSSSPTPRTCSRARST